MTEKGPDVVNGIWKFVAITAIGIILGGAPGYISLALDHHATMTRTDVDSEIISQNGSLVQSVNDLREEVNDLKTEARDTNGKIDELSKFERGK